MSSHFTPFTLKDISRPGGGFAMLAVDQREALRRVLLLFFHGFSYSFGLLSLQRG